jgi:hypothetical protein
MSPFAFLDMKYQTPVINNTLLVRPEYLITLKMATSTPPTVKKIALVTGSTRALRIGPDVTQLIHSITSTALSPLPVSPVTSFSLNLVDIATFKLPVFDEKVQPAAVPFMAQFEKEHSIAVSF